MHWQEIKLSLGKLHQNFVLFLSCQFFFKNQFVYYDSEHSELTVISYRKEANASILKSPISLLSSESDEFILESKFLFELWEEFFSLYLFQNFDGWADSTRFGKRCKIFLANLSIAFFIDGESQELVYFKIVGKYFKLLLTFSN